MNKAALLTFVLGLTIPLSALAAPSQPPATPSSNAPACHNVGGQIGSPLVTPSASCQVQCGYGGIVSCYDQSPYQYCEPGADYVFCYSTGYIYCSDCYPRFYCSA